MKSHNVRFWEIRPRKTAKGSSWTVRWTVEGREKSATLAKKAQAERHRSKLMQAADRGEAFDVETGLPDSMVREVSSVTWYQHACAFADVRWPKVAAKGRISLVEGLVAVTPVLVTSHRGAPDAEILRQAMRRWAFNPPRRSSPMPAEIEKALRWLDRSSVPVSALQGARTVSQALDACGRKLDGSAAAPEYYRRRRRILYAALKYAVREGHLSANPLDGTNEPEWKAPEVSSAVDRRRVASPAQMEELLAAIETVGRTQGPRLKALFGCMYYGMLRPSEATSLLLDECKLPRAGLGAARVQRDQLSGRTRLDRRRRGPRSQHAQGRPAERDPPDADPASPGQDDRRSRPGLRHRARRSPVPDLPRRHLLALHALARPAGGAPTGPYPSSAEVPADPQALRLPPRRCLLAPQRRRPRAPGRRVGGPHSRGPPPHLRPLHRRRRRPLVRPDGGRARPSLIWPVRWQYPACSAIESGEGWDNG